MKVIIKKKGKRILAFVLVLSMVLGISPFSTDHEVQAAAEPILEEDVKFSDTFDAGTEWNTASGNWRLGSASHLNLVGVRNGTAPLGYATSTRQLYNVELEDVHVGADVCVTKAECKGSNLQYHFLVARANASATNSVAFGFKTTKNATKSSLVVGYYTGNDAISIWHETEAVYNLNTAYALDLYVVGSLVIAKCNNQLVYLDEVTGINEKGYCGITDRRATSNSSGTVFGTDYTKAGYFDNFTVGTVEEIVADGFKVNGPVVLAKDGTGVADITLISGGKDGVSIDDATVKVDELKNQPTNLYEGEYSVTAIVGGVEKSAIATRVFVVDDLSKTVTRMSHPDSDSDSPWTGAAVDTNPRFAVDTNGVATLTPSGTAAAGLSVLNVGADNGAYGNFYAEYSLTVSDLAAEARGYFDTIFCMDSYGATGGNAWAANLFFDNRASQAPNKTFWGRLKGTTTTNFSDTTADTDIGVDKPMTVGMLVYDKTITLYINGDQVATYTGTTDLKGWFGIAQSSSVGKATVKNFVYIPLQKKTVDVVFDAPEAVMQGEAVEVKATPTYNWPYGVGEKATAIVNDLDTSTDGEKTYKVSFDGIEKELKIIVTKKPDGFKVNGPVVVTKDGKGVADITILAGTTELEKKEDVEVTLTGSDNSTTGLYEGNYEVTTEISGTARTAIATRVFVVDDLSKTVTRMSHPDSDSDSHWTGVTATTSPRFTADVNGVATLTPSGKVADGISVLNVGTENDAYGNFYAEYSLTVSDLAAEARGYFDTIFCMDSYGATGGNAWAANLFFDNRASQAPNKTFWGRLKGTTTTNFSDTTADTDVGVDKPMTVGMLVYDKTITLYINGDQVATYTGTTDLKGWFGIAQSSAVGKATIENFIYIPLTKELLDVEFICSESVMQGGDVVVKAIPTYNWPYGTGEATTEGVTVNGLDTSKTGEQSFKATYGGIEKDLKITVVDKPDGFRVDGPVVVTADGKGVADITILVGDTEVEYIEDAKVTVEGLNNPSVGLYEGSYEVTYDVYGTLRTASAERVFVVNNLNDAVTNMSDARWDGQTAIDTMPNFTVDETGGKATLSASSSASKAMSILNVGKNAGKYSNFYVEYVLTMSNIPTANNAFENYFCMDDTYTTYNKNSLNASIFFDTRSTTAVEKNFYARLRELDSAKNAAWSNNYSDKTEDVNIGDGIPMTIGMYVYDGTVTLLINGEEVITHTGKESYEGRFGIWLGNTTATATVEDFLYVPLGVKKLEDIKFSYPQTVPPGASVKVSAIPVYNWPYGEGEVITEGVVVTGLDTSTLGEKTFKASYGGVEKTLSIVVSKTTFEEDFSGTLSDLTENGWGNVSKKTTTLLDEKLYLTGSQEGLYATEVTGSDVWSDYTVKADVMMTSDGKSATTNVATLVARSTGLKDGYEWSLCVNKDGASYVRLYDRATTKQLMKVDYPVDLNEVYTLKLTVVGNAIKGYVNGEKIIETTADTCLKGTVGLRRNGYGVYYDNLLVTLPEEDASVPDVTKQQIWFTDTFEDESTMTERGWNMEGTIKNGKLVLTHKNPTSFLTQISGSSGWTDYTVKADIAVVESDEISSVNNSVSALIVRSISESTGYEFGVSIMASDDKGGFRLYNRTTKETLASTKDIVAERGKTYQLTTVVEGNRILCFVDGKLVFDVTDTKNSNPSGYVGLRTVGYSGAYDNIIVRKLTDADRKGIISDSNSDSPATTSPTTGDVAMPIYIPIIVMVVSLAVVVFYIRRRFYTKQ